MRRFVYEYNSNRLVHEVEVDHTDDMAIPDIGAIMNRHDREWKVVSISAPADQAGFAPVVRLFLSEVKKYPLSAKHLPK